MLTELLTLASLAVLALGLAILIFYLPKLRRATHEEHEAASILHDMLGELHNRLDQQDRKIADHTVRLDVVEVKLSRTFEQDRERSKIVVREMARTEAEPVVDKVVASRISQRVREVNPTEQAVLAMLKEGPMTAKEVQMRAGRSREHTSRLIKKLFDEGFVDRVESMRPFTYVITEKGRESLESKS